MSAGATGAVVSGDDVSIVREVVDERFCPTCRGPSTGSNGYDQVRVLTPEEAVEAGADYLVIGRPIAASPDAGTARTILSSVR